MAFLVKDRVQETCAAPGTGTVTLLGAATGYQSFSAAIGANNTTFYAIADQGGANWEVGLGTIGAGGTTLARTTILASSNGGSATNFSSGVQNIWCDYAAGKAVILDASNKLNAGGEGYLDFASVSPAVAAGRQWYDGTTGSWNLGMGGGNITQQVGEELFVYGKASAAITDSPLQIIKQTAPVGSSGVVGFAPTTSGITNGDLIIGVATESLALNDFGRVTCFGTVRGITTNGTAYGETWADGDVIWYNPTTGNPTNVKPVAPNIKVSVGVLIKAGSGGSGSIAVEINHGSVLGGTDSNVQITSPTNKDLLQYNGTYWGNITIPAAFGTQTANTVWAGPTTGAAANPSFRALVAADIPSTYSEFPSGTALLFQQTTAPTGWTKITTTNDAALRIVSGSVTTGGTVGFTTAFASQAVSGSVAATASTVATGSVADTASTIATGSVAATASTVAGGTNSSGSVSATTLTTAQIPSHTHYYATNTGYVSNDWTNDPNVAVDNGVGSGYQRHNYVGENYNCGIYAGGWQSSGISANHYHSFSGTTDGGTPTGGSHTHSFTQPTFTGTGHTHTSGAFTGVGHTHTSGAFTGVGHTHTSGAFTGTAINLAVKYIDAIICTKN